MRTGSAGIEFGVDIPFWYDSIDDLTGELPLIEYRGTRKPANEHILDLVDSAAVMTCRTAAYGADSIVVLAEGELKYAAAKGKRVFIGLETTDLPDEDLIEFEGAPGRGLPAGAPAGDTVVIEPGAGTGTVWVGSRAGWDGLRAKLDAGPPALSRSRSLWWPVRRIVAVPGAKPTFSRLGGARLDDAMTRVLLELGHRPSFGGFAIHDYLGYLFGTMISIGSVVIEEMTYHRYNEPRDLMRLLGACFLEHFPYRQLNSLWRLRGMWEFLTGKTSWQMIDRVGLGAKTSVTGLGGAANAPSRDGPRAHRSPQAG